MLWSLAVLILCQAAGEILHVIADVPVPGPVLGIGLLLLALYARDAGKPKARLVSPPVNLPAADALLSYLPLFFVPPGVGALMQIGRLVHVWPAVLLALVGSSVLTFAVAGRLAQTLIERQEQRTRTRKSPAPDGAPESAS